VASLVRRSLGLLLASILVTACAGELDGVAPATPKAPYTLAPPTPTFSPERTAAPTGHKAPYSPDELYGWLARSPGVPDQLRTRVIAEAIASRIWSYDGLPYQELKISARCDDDGRRCDLFVKGVPGFAPDRDTADSYTFSITIGTGLVEDEGPQGLGGYPAELLPELDAEMRALMGDRIGDRSLLGVSWLLPPPDDGFRLRYGHGTELGEQQLLVRYDRAANEVLSVSTE
jgi:hypothetical protein